MTTTALPRFTINQQASTASQLGKPHHTDPKYAKCVGFDDDLVALEKFFTWKSDLDRAKTYTPFLNKYYEPSIYRAEDISGEETLLKVKQTVHGFFPKGRFPFQISLHRQILRATLKQTLGDDYDRCVNRVCEEHGWDGPKRNLIAIASRRSGKTTATASMVASLLINVPTIEIVVYSVGLRSAQEFVRLVERYIQMHEVGRDMIKNPGGSETLVLRGKNPGDTRRIRSFPSGGNAKNVSTRRFFLFVCISTFISGAALHTHFLCRKCNNPKRKTSNLFRMWRWAKVNWILASNPCEKLYKQQWMKLASNTTLRVPRRLSPCWTSLISAFAT
jgi:hypothetical protein